MIEPGDRVRVVVDKTYVSAGETGVVSYYDSDNGIYQVELDDGPATGEFFASELTRIPGSNGSRGAKS